MSKLQTLCGNAKAYNIGGVELDLKPRRLEEIELLMQLQDPAKQGEAMSELIKRTLKEAVPDATDEEINNLSLEHLKPITEAIMDVNGLKNETN